MPTPMLSGKVFSRSFILRPLILIPLWLPLLFPTITSPLGIKKTEDPPCPGIFLGYPFGQIFSLSLYDSSLKPFTTSRSISAASIGQGFEELLRGKSFALSYSVSNPQLFEKAKFENRIKNRIIEFRSLPKGRGEQIKID
ncbi:hypothetical protein L1987_88770 [Smallanthus sonchifolius]|nr:hypothetical protein L1987_88770 [Smallanthus sonchifolius]